jgi:hypothetical protein
MAADGLEAEPEMAQAAGAPEKIKRDDNYCWMVVDGAQQAGRTMTSKELNDMLGAGLLPIGARVHHNTHGQAHVIKFRGKKPHFGLIWDFGQRANTPVDFTRL